MYDPSTLRPQVRAIDLRDALPDILLPDPVVVSGVSVASDDLDPGWAFVAIGGARHHGIKFAAQAERRGAVVVITDAAGRGSAGGLSIPVVVVDDPRAAAARVAKALYGPLIAQQRLVSVTGTNGKTTTTYLVRAALAPLLGPSGLMGTLEIDVDDHPLVASRTTAESPVVYRALGVAAQGGRRASVIEASAHALSLNRLDGLRFDTVIFTNLQHDHLDYYVTMDNYFQAKASLFDPERAKNGVVCVDDEWGRRLAARAEIPVATVSALSPTPDEFHGASNHWEVVSAANDPERWGVSFELRDPSGHVHRCFCPIPGLVNVQNAAVALVAAVQLGASLEQAIQGLASAPPVPGRMEIVPGDLETQPRVLVDYAHTAEALEAVLDTLRPLVSGRLILVFGTDGDRDATKREHLAQVAARGADTLWVTDENPRSEDAQSVRDYLLRGIRSVRSDFADAIEVTTCRRDAIREAILAARPGDLVVITGKGAEPFQEVRGVFHPFLDSAVAAEVLASPASRKESR